MPESSRIRSARRVWQLMFQFLMQTAPERGRSLGRRGLTPNDSRALSSLDTAEGRTMRSLADQWECNASNATWIVDRLEKLGLAERRADPHDRRARLVVLTARGARLKAELIDEFLTPPRELLEVEPADLDRLERALEKLPKARSAEPPAAEPRGR